MTRAAVITEIGAPFEIADIVVDLPQGEEVLIDVRASGLCHSDLNFARNDYGEPMPFVVGHEVSGEVVAIGPGVREFEVGDHVVGSSIPTCGYCTQCRSGFPVRCVNQGIARRPADAPPRLTIDGAPLTQVFGLAGFAERVLIHSSQLIRIDRRVPFDRAALLACGVATGAGAVIRSARVQPMDTVVVIGAGGVGLNAIQTAALVGARKVIAIDVVPGKLDLATLFGATHVVNAAAVDPVESVRELTDGAGAEHVFEMTGLHSALVQSTQMRARGGTNYVVGMQKLGTTLEFPVAFTTFTSQHQGIRGISMGGTNFKVDLPYYAELYLQGRFNLDDLVSRSIRLDDINAGYDELHSGIVARSVITF